MNIKKHKAAACLSVFLLTAVILVSTVSCRSELSAEFTGFAMDTVISVKLYGCSDPERSLSSVNRIFKETEHQISRHYQGSDVSRLNSGETLTPDEPFLLLLEKNLEMWKKTGGLFDITSGPLIDLWNIGSGSERVPEPDEIKAALEDISSERISVSGNQLTLKPGTVMDLGASGKGYVLDLIRAYLSETDTLGACISAGGSVLLYGTHDGKKTYSVAVRHPDDGAAYLGMLTLSDCTVSTSGDYERCFFADGRRYHHILSPFTGYPAETGLRSVTIVSPDGTMSDILSTAVFLLGKERGLSLLSDYNAEGILVSDDHTVTVTQGLQDRFRLTADGYTLEIYEGLLEAR